MTKISRGNLLGSGEEKLTFNKLFIERAKGLTKIVILKGKSTVIISQQSREPKTTMVNDKNNLKAIFRLLALFVYIQLYPCRRLSCNHNSSLKLYRFPIFAGFVEGKSCKHAALKLFDEHFKRENALFHV